jgi:hypothetical protein
MQRSTRKLATMTLLALVTSVSTHATTARAQEAADKAAAEALFDEGRKLMAAGDFEEACPKLEASQRLDPGVGTMLNLADCHEKSGRTASAWAQFREAISAAHKAGSLEREEIARSRARELESKLSYLTIETWKGQKVQVTRDGTAVDEAVLGSAIPVDPGEHVISAAAVGKRSWSTTVQVGPTADRVSVAVPILPDEQGGASGVAPPAGGEPTPPATTSGSISTQRVLAIATGAVGVVGLGLGVGFGLKAASKWDDAKSRCTPYPNNCDAQSAHLADAAKSSATVSTIAFAVGVAGIAGGLVLWLTAPKHSAERSASLDIGPGSVHLRGRF